jgi:hypothetical protein
LFRFATARQKLGARRVSTLSLRRGGVTCSRLATTRVPQLSPLISPLTAGRTFSATLPSPAQWSTGSLTKLISSTSRGRLAVASRKL